MYGIVYLITNSENGKQYVGQTLRSLEERWSEHVRKAKAHDNHYLGKAILRYGSEKFSIEEICQTASQEELDHLEIETIARLNTLRPHGYNLTKGGLGGAPDEETREKIRQSKMGDKNPNYQRIYTPEERERISQRLSGKGNPFYGRKHSRETKKKLAEIAKTRGPSSRKGKKASVETKTKLRKAWAQGREKRIGQNHPMFGRKVSAETRQKISQAHKKLKLNKKKSSCLRGHPYNKLNTYIHNPTGKRYCRTCNKERYQRRKNGSRKTNV